jgi:peroxiredoxin
VRLQEIAARVARDFPEYTIVAEAFIQRLITGQSGAGAPPVGDPLPDFFLPNANGGFSTLAAFAGRPLVVLLMRGHWCDFCDAQAQALADAAPDFAASGAAVAIITPELPRYSQPLVARAPDFHLLCDLDHAYTATLGLMAAMDEALAKQMANFDIDLPTFQGALGWAVPIPAAFVVNAHGTILDRRFDPDFRRRPSIQALLNALARANS